MGHPGGRVDFERELLRSEVNEHLRALVSGLGVTQRTLAGRTNKSEARISRIMTARENVTLATLAELGWALGLRFELVAMPLEDRSGTPAEHDAPAPEWLAAHAQLLADRARSLTAPASDTAARQQRAEASAEPEDAAATTSTIRTDVRAGRPYFEDDLTGANVTEHERPHNMHTDRTRNDPGQLRQKRGDTLVGNIEREYDVDFGVRADMRLDTLRERTGLTSMEDLLRHARERK